MRVDILLPSYNHARFLRACLESVRAQTFTGWRLIALDDGSTDNSLTVLREFEGPNFTVVQNATNLGTYGTLAKALDLGESEYVAVLNSDDIWSPKKLERQVALLDANPGCPYAYTLGRRIDASGVANESQDDHEGWPLEETQETLPFLLEENRILASSVLMRRDFASFEPSLRYSGDWVALLRLARHGPATLVRDRLTFWRMHDSNTFRRSPEQVQEEIMVRESILSASWNVRSVTAADVRRGLGRNALHLSALYALQGRTSEARGMAVEAVRLNPGLPSVRRLAALLAGKNLWPDATLVDKGRVRPMIDFSGT